MATAKQNDDFKDTLIPEYPLDEAVYWIKNNMEPEDVFTDAQLLAWAESKGYVKDE